MKNSFILFFYLFEASLYAQTELLPPTILPSDYQSFDSCLVVEFGNNKQFIKEFELQTLIALSKYPELKNTRIQIKNKKIKTTMACRPTIFSIFMKNKKRKYNIYINNQSVKLKSIQAGNLSFNAQIGVLSHELAHIIDYNSKNSFQLIALAYKYNSKKWRVPFEHSVDSIALSRGFGWQLYEYSKFIQTSADVPVKYKMYKKKTYYTPDDILLKIKQFYLKNIFNYWYYPILR